MLNAAVPGVSGGKITATDIVSSGGIATGDVQQFLTTQDSYETVRPKAFINWVLFDEQLKFVEESSGFEQVPDEGWFVNHTLDEQMYLHLRYLLPITKNGFLYVYTSNETPNIDVFFDNLQVTHVRGPLLEETHYYPFGLTMAGISSKVLAFGVPENKYKFNDGTELNTDFNINLYETTYRGHDPQIGRFWQIDPLADRSNQFSPYAYANNNPISLNDPEGLFAGDLDPNEDDRPRVTEKSFYKKWLLPANGLNLLIQRMGK